MAFSGDPVGERLAAGLPRPGGNVTGQSTAVAEVAAKRLEFLKTIVPRLSHVSHLLMTEQTRRAVTETEAAGQTLGVQVTAMPIRNASELDRAFASMLRAHVGGVIVSLTLRPHFQAIAQFALKNRLPTISGPREFVEAGGLMAYGPHYPDLFRRSAAYVDKILRGARPAELPIEQPTKFELIINLKTAAALGLAIPPALLLSADEVVE
jgi:putative ABC transport system substrate-binding protein